MTSSEKYGADKSIASGVANYFYSPRTKSANLQKHLYQVHRDEYDKVVLQHKSSELHNASTHNAHNRRELPSFSLVVEHPIHLVVADD